MKKTIYSWGIALSLLLSVGLSACSDDETNKEEGGETPVGGGVSAYSLAIPEFKDSYVYVAKEGDVKIAEICNEYIPLFSKDKRATVVYPCDKTGKVNYLKGYVVDNGGLVAWEDGVCTYDAGSLTESLKTVYIDSNRVFAVKEALKGLSVEADVVKDADGNTYGVVKIGMQHWLRENFKSTKYNDGKSIKTDVLFENWGEETEGTYGTYVVPEGKNPAIVGTPEIAKQNFGLFYSWNATKNLAPKGWHLPSNKEWNALRTFLGDDETMLDEAVAGGLLQKVDENLWSKPSCATPNYVATDIAGFSAVGAGVMQFGICTQLKEGGYWWASDTDPESEDYGETYAFFWSVNNIRATLLGGMVYNYNPDTEEAFYAASSLPATCGCTVRFLRSE